VRVAGVVHDQVGDDPDPAVVRLVDELHEVAEVAELRQDLEEVGDVVAAVAQRRLVDRQQPQAVDAEPLQVVHLVGQAADVAGAVAAGVVEAADEHLVEDRALVPGGVVALERHGQTSRTVKMCAGSVNGSSRTYCRLPSQV
jgi:hypothetical protein